jgi:hypothetical protein
MTSPGVISAVELYSLPEAKRRLRLGRHSFRALRQAGLQILRVGRCHFVSGQELIDVIKRTGDIEHGSDNT